MNTINWNAKSFFHLCTYSFAHHKHINLIVVPNIMQNMPNMAYVSFAIQKPSPLARYPALVRKWNQKVLTYDSLQLPQPYFRKLSPLLTSQQLICLCLFAFIFIFLNLKMIQHPHYWLRLGFHWELFGRDIPL